jgi:hypothetical protein
MDGSARAEGRIRERKADQDRARDEDLSPGGRAQAPPAMGRHLHDEFGTALGRTGRTARAPSADRTTSDAVRASSFSGRPAFGARERRVAGYDKACRADISADHGNGMADAAHFRSDTTSHHSESGARRSDDDRRKHVSANNGRSWRGA